MTTSHGNLKVMPRKKNARQNKAAKFKDNQKEVSQNVPNGQMRDNSHAKANGFVPESDSGNARNVSFVSSSKRKNKSNNVSNGGLHKSPSTNTLNRLERQKFVLWKRPFQTLYYFLLESAHLAWTCVKSFICVRRLLPTLLLVFSAMSLYAVPGVHTQYLRQFEKKILWCLYWIGLGVLSSVGLGTGLHTFLLYLGPHIARVTLAAYECNSLDFPEPPYPDDVTCPSSSNSLATAVSFWAIISKVRLESLMWGAGTALGELPPYFMARAARLSGEEPEDEDYKEFLHFVEGQVPEQIGLFKRWKLSIERWMEQVVMRVGFPGILLFASIPNPLFDLAGITCGHFLIPFWTFFGATLMGKALMFFVVLTFSEHHVEHLVAMLKQVPRVGPYLHAPFKEFLQAQKLRLHRQPGDPVPEQATSMLQQGMSYVVSIMIFWFVISIVNSLAQSYHKRQSEMEVVKKVK